MLQVMVAVDAVLLNKVIALPSAKVASGITIAPLAPS